MACYPRSSILYPRASYGATTSFSTSTVPSLVRMRLYGRKRLKEMKLFVYYRVKAVPALYAVQRLHRVRNNHHLARHSAGKRADQPSSCRAGREIVDTDEIGGGEFLLARQKFHDLDASFEKPRQSIADLR